MNSISKKISKVLALALPLILLAGGIYDYFSATRIPSLIRESEGLSYYYWWEDGFWITDRQQLDQLAALLEQGEVTVDWRDSFWFLVHGGNSCSCGQGEPIKLRGIPKLLRLKHGNFQGLGFISVHNTDQRGFMNEIQSLIREWED